MEGHTVNVSNLAREAYAPGKSPARAPRSSEHAALASATRLLKVANTPDARFPDLMKALEDNRRVWSFFADAVSDDQNALPEDTRAQILSLAMFTFEHTRKIINREATLEPLIDVNQAIMRGLRGEGGAS
jgi:flagellar protein FlaF